MAIDMDQRFTPTGRWEVNSVWDPNYDGRVWVVIDPEGVIDDWYEPWDHGWAMTDASNMNEILDRDEHENPENPCLWQVELVRTDGEGTFPDHKRLVFVWGFAAAQLDCPVECPRESTAILRRLHDHKGFLTATWSDIPDESDKRAITLAWAIAGGEIEDAIEHVVEPLRP